MHILKAHQDMIQELDQRLAETVDEEHDDLISKTASNNSKINRTGADLLSYRWNLVPMVYLPWFAGLF